MRTLPFSVSENGRDFFPVPILHRNTNPLLHRNDAFGMGSATVPVAPASVSLAGPIASTHPLFGETVRKEEVFGGTPKTAGETPALPTANASAQDTRRIRIRITIRSKRKNPPTSTPCHP